MKKVHTLPLLMLTLTLISSPVAADWFDSLKKAVGSVVGSESASEGVDAVLSQEDTVAGLKEALTVGVERAVKTLGAEGGFLNDVTVRIPMPEVLAKARPVLATFGQERYVDEFEETMNRAAELAAPRAAAVFGDAVRQMSIKDAQAILGGPDDAATRYFRERAGAALHSEMLPIVSVATEEAGATGAYKFLVDKADAFISTEELNLDRYVTDRAIDGVFLKLAEEEKKIRENPLARSTDLLKKVFAD